MPFCMREQSRKYRQNRRFAFFNNILDEIVAEIFNTEQAVIYDFSVGGKTFHRAIDIRRSKTQTEALALSNIACDLV